MRRFSNPENVKVKDLNGFVDPVVLSYIAAAAIIGISHAVAKRRANSPQFMKKMQAQNDEHNDMLSKKYMTEYADLRDFTDSHAKKIQGEHSLEDDLDAVNPLYDKNLDHTTVNCSLCSLTYDLRRRGYDVTSKMSSKGNIPEALIDDLYNEKEPSLKMEGLKSWDQVEKKVLNTYPDGARGHFSIRTPFGMGHSMSFEIADRKMIVYDPQSGRKNVKMDSDLFNLYPPSMSTFDRLDHRTINWKNASKVCAELKSDWKSHVPQRKSNEQAIPVTTKHQQSNTNGRVTEYEKMMIRKYKREHDTNLSDSEILDNIRGL